MKKIYKYRELEMHLGSHEVAPASTLPKNDSCDSMYGNTYVIRMQFEYSTQQYRHLQHNPQILTQGRTSVD